jgi:acetyltransferase-like isoleucine patch superfamily enzyme
MNLRRLIDIFQKFLLPLFVMPLPSCLKVWLFRKAGNTVGKGCYIGFSFIDTKELIMGDYVYIGHFNILRGLRRFSINTGSRITLCNWVTGGTTGSFTLGRNSSISGLHYFEASADIIIGMNTVIAGRSSQFFSHGISPTNLDDRRPIQIGDWCYIGSAVRIVPGVVIADHTFVGMGSVLSKRFSETYVLIAGAPARIRKKLSETDIFFNRAYHRQPHHPAIYHG